MISVTTVYASEDTYSLSDEDYQHGSASDLAIINNATHVAHIYIKFDLSGWAGKTLDPDDGGLLKLRITSNEIPSGLYTKIRFRRITGSWDESTLKWSNAPSTTTTNGKSKQIYSTASGWDIYNITELLQDIIDDEGCCGVYIEIDDYVVWFSSSEGSYTPKLSLTEAVSRGDILRGSSYPSSQVPGENVDMVVDIKNGGSVGGYFVLSYYEGSAHLRTASRAWVSAGQTITDISERFTMPDRDFVVTVRMHNESTEDVDDTYNITCYLIGGTDYYVNTSGNDELPGSSWAMAWATIDKAARTVPDGATVHIGFGDYNNEPPGNKIAPQNIGSEGITYIPETAESEGGIGTATIEKNA